MKYTIPKQVEKIFLTLEQIFVPPYDKVWRKTSTTPHEYSKGRMYTCVISKPYMFTHIHKQLCMLNIYKQKFKT